MMLIAIDLHFRIINQLQALWALLLNLFRYNQKGKDNILEAPLIHDAHDLFL